MAGHSKWANIRFRKGAQDAKRGKIFTKLIREIVVASKMGGADPDSNPRLRAAIDKSYDNNMPKDKVEKAIKRGSGAMDGENYEEVRYEGYGVAGVAVMVDCLTDNRNRTVAEVRHCFSKCGGNLGTDGSVGYLFTKQGEIDFADGVDENALIEVALEAGAADIINNDDGSVEVITDENDLMLVKDKLEAAGFRSIRSEAAMVASTEVVLDAENAEKLLKMVDMLEDLDDVQNVYTNADISAEVLATLDK